MYKRQACNYNASATDSGSCSYPVDLYGVSYVDCDNACLNDSDGDGVCDEIEVLGCTDGDAETNAGIACNYDSSATDDDGSCEYTSCAGCLTESACNYNSSYTIADSDQCTFAETYYDCNGDCNTDTDGDSVCDELEIEGCQDSTACNYNINATDSSDCTYPSQTYLDCVGDCLNDSDGDGVCDEIEVSGCTNAGACNYDSSATDDDSSCTFTTDVAENIDCDCAAYDCNGNCNTDTDGDGVCDELEIEGCQDSTACNYNASATDSGTCSYPVDLYGVSYVDCDNACLNDSDGDGVCDEIEVDGCTDASACNYDSSATDDDGSCTYIANVSENIDCDCTAYDCNGDCNTDTDGDGVCDELEVVGCQDSTACNYNASATDSGSCSYPVDLYGVSYVDCDLSLIHI